MGMNTTAERHVISFGMGTRWKVTDEMCPKCGEGRLNYDSLSEKDGDFFKCFRCGFDVIRKPSISEVNLADSIGA